MKTYKKGCNKMKYKYSRKEIALRTKNNCYQGGLIKDLLATKEPSHDTEGEEKEDGEISCPLCRLNLKRGLPRQANHVCCPQGLVNDMKKHPTPKKNECNCECHVIANKFGMTEGKCGFCGCSTAPKKENGELKEEIEEVIKDRSEAEQMCLTGNEIAHLASSIINLLAKKGYVK